MLASNKELRNRIDSLDKQIKLKNDKNEALESKVCM